MSFANKVVLVIGACSGIGASTAVRFTKKGADVVMVGRITEKLSNVAEECKKQGKEPFVIKADISKDEEAVKIVEESLKKYSKIDVLVNNAGMASLGTILDGKLLKSYDETMQTNLRALVHLVQLTAPHLIKTKGNIVNTSSIAATITPVLPSLLAYGVSKAGLNHFTKCAARELAPHGVRVNAVSPGPVKTDFIQNFDAKTLNNYEITTPLNRISESAEIAELILFLASDKAIGITGSIFVSDNGYSL